MKKFIILSALLMWNFITIGQIIHNVNTNSGTFQNPILEIDSIVFSPQANQMQIRLNNGSQQSFSITEIFNVTFTDGNSSGLISSLDCQNANIYGVITTGIPLQNVEVTIPYEGGNGGNYTGYSANSTGVTGLIINLNPGFLSNGNGELVFSISGTTSDTGIAIFSINVGGQSCSININVTQTLTTGCGNADILNPSLEYGSIEDIEGNIYRTIIIGNQEWMAENLRVSHFNNGIPIPQVNETNEWSQQINPAWCYFDYNESYNCPYGKLYNWYTTVDIQSLCPTGWHVPSDDEWVLLIEQFGVSWQEAGNFLREVQYYWNDPQPDVTNSSGFSAIPAGRRASPSGFFSGWGGEAAWWSSTSLGTSETAWGRSLTGISLDAL